MAGFTITGITISEMAKELGIKRNAVLQRLYVAGIKPITKEAIYPESALEAIRNVPGRGRPKNFDSDFTDAITYGSVAEIIEKEVLYRRNIKIYLYSAEKIIITDTQKGNFRFEHDFVYNAKSVMRPYQMMDKYLADRYKDGEIRNEDVEVIKMVVGDTVKTFNKQINKIMESIGSIWKGTVQLEALEKELKLRGMTIPWGIE